MIAISSGSVTQKFILDQTFTVPRRPARPFGRRRRRARHGNSRPRDGGKEDVGGDINPRHRFIPLKQDWLAPGFCASCHPLVTAPFPKSLLAELFTMPRLAAIMSMFAQAERVSAGDRIASLGHGDAKGRIAFLLVDILHRLRSADAGIVNSTPMVLSAARVERLPLSKRAGSRTSVIIPIATTISTMIG